jgi:salicylate hydroxylase
MTDKIIIIGAGIGGLTAALALQQRGLEVVVCEQASELREVGAGVQLSPNGTRVLAALGLLEALRAVSAEPAAKEIRLWSTGDSWPLFDLGTASVAEYGFPYLMVHRGDLHALLAQAVRRASPDAIQLGARLVDIAEATDGVTVTLADGRHIAGALLIGADGVHSQVRALRFGAGQASFTGCSAWRGVVPAERLPPRLARQVGVNWVGPGHHVVTYPLRRGELINVVCVVESADWETESWTTRGSRDDCAADFAGWHQDVHILIDNIDVHYRWALLSRAPIERWHDGRTVLLGDACHPMLPFMAQGAVMAIEDGLVLARCLEAHPNDPARAFAGYEAARVARANRCVRAAERNRQIFHDGRLAEPADAARYVATQWNETAVRERYDWLFAHDALTCPITPSPDGRGKNI